VCGSISHHTREKEKQKTSLFNYEAGQRDPDAKNSIVISSQVSFDDIREKWPISANLPSSRSYFDRQGIPEEVLKVPPQENTRDLSKEKNDGVGDDEKDKNQEIEAGRSRLKLIRSSLRFAVS